LTTEGTKTDTPPNFKIVKTRQNVDRIRDYLSCTYWEFIRRK